MSYYDSTVANYDRQISSNNNSISTYTNKIKSLEDDIDELKKLRIRVGDVDDAVVAAASASENKVNNLPGLIMNPLSVLKTTFFSSFLDVVKGPEHTKARKGVESAFGKIDAKIKELQGNIEDLQAEIKQCNNTVKSLTNKRRKYIEEQTAKQEAENSSSAEAKA